MSNPEVITVNSEALEATIRDLLPSQRGFGSELQASNVIMPIIDLTATAEGSVLGTNLQQAMAFGSQTTTTTANTTNTLINTTGFYRVFGTCTVRTTSAVAPTARILLNDGSSTKNVYEIQTFTTTNNELLVDTYDFVVFLAAGDSLQAFSNSAQAYVATTTRQLATITGDLVNPSGFTAE